jgi:glutathione synthase/RimK-type ligase-like ATP-grasp enzyme
MVGDGLKREYRSYDAGVVLIQPKLRVRQWYRCIVVGGEYLGEMRHRQKDKYGGDGGVMLKLSDDKMARLKQICLEASKLFVCEYAGLDVVYDEDRRDFVILEVNRTAQFKYFEKRTGVNVAEKIVELMRRRAV